MATRALLLTGTRVLFAGLLAGVFWADRRPGQQVATGAADIGRYGFVLREVSAEAGIDFRHAQVRLDPLIANVEPHVAAMGAAVSVADADGDGWPDLYATTSAFGTRNALYLNRHDGRFEELAGAAGIADVNRDGEGASMGSVWADADNDGDEDLFLYKWGYAQLFRNDGKQGAPSFTDVTQAAGLRRWMNSNSAVWFDYDRDGRIDLYVAGYFPETLDLWHLKTTRIMQDSFEFATNGGHNVLWRNLGPGPDGVPRFEDVTEATGCDSTRWTLAVAAADFDGDGWQDLYLANDYGPEELFLNVDGERFEIASVGLGEDSKSGMAVAVGDVRNDGTLATFVTNISKAGYLFQGNNLRLNLLHQGGLHQGGQQGGRGRDGAGQGAPDDASVGSGRFENVAQGVVADCGWAWGAQFGDLDNDGWQDLFVVNGFISADREQDYWYDMGKVAGGAGNLFMDTKHWAPIGSRSLSGYERSRVLLNRRKAPFVDVAAAVGVTDELDGRAVALADLWNRGVLDVVVANQKGPLLVYRNEVAPGRGWIGFDLRGEAGNRSAIGAQLTLSAGGMRQAQVVMAGSGFCSQNDRRLHFGLGEATAVEQAVIRWPSGREQVLAAPEPGRMHVVKEPVP
jgi:enediyne biosynthesis protein E4